MPIVRRIGLIFSSAALAILPLCLGAWLLSSAPTARAQAQWEAVSIPPASAVGVISTAEFPTVTVNFPCAISDGTYLVMENGVMITDVKATTRSVPVNTRTAIVLDLFRRSITGDEPVLSPVMASVLLSAGDVVSKLIESDIFTVTAHQLGIFAPAADAYRAASIISPTTWTFDLGKLFNALYTDYVPGAEPVFRAEVGRTMTATKLLDILNGLLGSELSGDVPEQQALIVYSDGSDGGSSTPLATVIEAAKARGIPIYTVFIPTAPNADANLKRLAGDTNDRYEPVYTNTTRIVDWLTAIYAPQIVCDIVYRTRQNPPTRIEVQSVSAGVTSTAAVADISADFRMEPPFVAIKSPTFGQTFTRTETETIPLAATWQLSTGDYDHAFMVEFTVLAPTAAGADQIVTTHVTVLTSTSPLSHSIELSASAFLTGVHLFRTVVTDDFDLVGTAVQPFEVRPLPPPTTTPTPTVEIVREGFLSRYMSVANWLSGDSGTRTMLLTQVMLSSIVILLLAFLLHRVWRMNIPPVHSVTQASSEYAILDRVQTSEQVPHTKQMVRLVLNSNVSLELPAIFLESNALRYRSAEHAQFLRVYRATLACKDAVVTITRPSVIGSEVSGNEARDYKPIHILKDGARDTFTLDKGGRLSEDLQNKDIIQFGDLHYQFKKPAGANGRQPDATRGQQA